MKHEYSVIQGAAMPHSYKWANLSYLHKNLLLVQWTLVVTNSEGTTEFCSKYEGGESARYQNRTSANKGVGVGPNFGHFTIT